MSHNFKKIILKQYRKRTLNDIDRSGKGQKINQLNYFQRGYTPPIKRCPEYDTKTASDGVAPVL